MSFDPSKSMYSARLASFGVSWMIRAVLLKSAPHLEGLRTVAPGRVLVKLTHSPAETTSERFGTTLLREDSCASQEERSVTLNDVSKGRINNADSSRMGKAVEHLVAATCIIQSRARLNVSTSLVDDEGVDLVFHRRGGTDTLAVQVKARFNDSKALASGTFLQNVRSETLAPRDDLDVLFVAVDVASGSFDTCWLVPSADLAAKGMRDSRGRYQFRGFGQARLKRQVDAVSPRQVGASDAHSQPPGSLAPANTHVGGAADLRGGAFLHTGKVDDRRDLGRVSVDFVDPLDDD